MGVYCFRIIARRQYRISCLNIATFFVFNFRRIQWRLFDLSVWTASCRKPKVDMAAKRRKKHKNKNIYDAVGGKLLALKFAKLHEGVVKKGDFYVSCADFVDKKGTKVDLDFLVIKEGDNLQTIQALVHSLDGKKRKYHLEG